VCIWMHVQREPVEGGLHVCDECETMANVDPNGAENIRGTSLILRVADLYRGDGYRFRPYFHNLRNPRSQVRDAVTAWYFALVARISNWE
jgi:hypothetical protein